MDSVTLDLLRACKDMVASLDPKMVEAHDSGGLAAFGIEHGAACVLCRVRAAIAKAALKEPTE